MSIDTSFEWGDLKADFDSIDVTSQTMETVDEENEDKVEYLLYRFVGEVDSATGMIAPLNSDEGGMWQLTDYGEHEEDFRFELTYDTSLISKSKLEGMVGATGDVGMTPMLARQRVPYDEARQDHLSHVLEYETTNESLYSFATDGEIYPMVDDSTSVGDYRTYDLSDGEIESLRAQYDLADETSFEGATGSWSGLYGTQFQTYLDDLGDDLLNYIGTLMDPVINFNKTKNRKITDKQISSLHAMDTTATSVSLSVSAVDESYGEEA